MAVLAQIEHEVTTSEHARIRRAVMELPDREDTLGNNTTPRKTVKKYKVRKGSQPTTVPSVVVTPKPVERVHQIYGLFRDGKPMPDLFKKSQLRWEQVALTIGAKYHLWTADEVDTLVSDHYPDVIEMYRNVRYPIMRVDIGRIVILHCYGGLYADLDVVPCHAAFHQVDFAVCRQRKHKSKKQCQYEMEVLSAAPRNSVLVRWLDYMKTQISEKEFDGVNSFWRNAKMRYVFHTTGPLALARFLKLPANKECVAKIHLYHMNRPEEAATMTQVQKNIYDVITHQSMSYATTEQRIMVEMAKHAVPLPCRPIVRMRLTCKRMADDTAYAGATAAAALRVAPKPPLTAEELQKTVDIQARRIEKLTDVVTDFANNFHGSGNPDVEAAWRACKKDTKTWVVRVLLRRTAEIELGARNMEENGVLTGVLPNHIDGIA